MVNIWSKAAQEVHSCSSWPADTFGTASLESTGVPEKECCRIYNTTTLFRILASILRSLKTYLSNKLLNYLSYSDSIVKLFSISFGPITYNFFAICSYSVLLAGHSIFCCYELFLLFCDQRSKYLVITWVVLVHLDTKLI